MPGYINLLIFQENAFTVKIMYYFHLDTHQIIYLMARLGIRFLGLSTITFSITIHNYF